MAGRPPKRAADFRALSELAELQMRRAELLTWWGQLAREVDYPPDERLEHEPEVVFAELRPMISAALELEERLWRPFAQRLAEIGFQRPLSLNGPAGKSRLVLLRSLMPLLVGQLEERHRRSLRAGVVAGHATLVAEAASRCDGVDRRLAGQAVTACREIDATTYRALFREVLRLRALAPVLEARDRLLLALAEAASGWADAIRTREGRHAGGVLPGEPVAAWRLRQLREELDRRASQSAEAAAQKLEECERDLGHATVALIEAQAWTAQKTRTKGPQRQALVGWKDIQRATPKTSTVPGKIERLRRGAREAMVRCQTAVPVWIMPMHRVVESFDFREARFDVAIVDEASQNDILGLVLFALARKIVVVGDHEQVSPSDVGQTEAQVGRLIDEHLEGIPNSALYTGKTSIYHLSRESAGETIMLLEHFRCLPDVIEFSNQLCYEGRIRPLREPAAARVGPTFIPFRVDGQVRGGSNDDEAHAVASLVAACAESPAYQGLTLGVISLVGDEQAIRIDNLLRHHVDLQVLRRHRLVCGNAAQFQGDERDVMFLSMVDSPPEDPPLRLRNEEMFRQRFNVAVSRARDQVWVIHSLSGERDLKPDDLRRRLLVHAANPKAVALRIAAAQARAESEFEKLVAGMLIRRGYRVIPQYRVGYYRIDLVVEGGGHQLAVECDGDRFHTEEKLDEDLARQAVLERLGWRFVRIRGSLFFRDPDTAMAPVFNALERYGVTPAGGGEGPVDGDSLALRDEIIRRADALRSHWRDGFSTDSRQEQTGRTSPGASGSAEATPVNGHRDSRG